MNNWKMNIVALLSLLGFSNSSHAQNTAKGVVTERYRVNGNCGMCKKTIESAATTKAKSATWSEASKELSVTYNPEKTSADDILKQIAYAGYDNEKYLAPASAYQKLPACCQYERSDKAKNAPPLKTSHKEMANTAQTQNAPLEQVYLAYFDLKDALVKSDAKSAATKAKLLLDQLSGFNMASLSAEQHELYMKHLSYVTSESTAIAAAKDLDAQRAHFSTLSDHLFPIMKAVKPVYSVYREHCPMYNDGKGADWISKESQIKNPYYGSQMMSCGKVVETIK